MTGKRTKFIDPVLRFFERTERAESGPIIGGVRCLLWKAGKVSDGYGWIWNGKKQVGAHRFAYENFVGAIPDRMHVLHKCDNPSCAEPAHLFLGTHQENMADMMAKKRNARGPALGAVVKAGMRRENHRCVKQTHCIHGHAFDADNTYVTKTGSRTCRTCQRLYQVKLRTQRAALGIVYRRPSQRSASAA